MKRVSILGAIYCIAGSVGFIYLSYHLSTVAMKDGGRSYELAWYLSQALFPLFCAFLAVSGLGLVYRKMWASHAIKWLSLIAALYFLAFILMGAHSLMAVTLGVVGLAFFVLSFAMVKRASHGV